MLITIRCSAKILIFHLFIQSDTPQYFDDIARAIQGFHVFTNENEMFRGLFERHLFRFTRWHILFQNHHSPLNQRHRSFI